MTSRGPLGRWARTPSSSARAIAVLARAQQDAVWARTGAHNKLRSHLREYYPAFLAAFAAKLSVHCVSGKAPVMVGPGDEIAPRAGGHGHLRASDSDRAHVIDTLKAAYVDGLVTKDEFDARVSQTFASRTHAELALVTADIPAGLAAAQQPSRPAPARGSAPAHANAGPGDRAIYTTAVFAVLALLISVSAGPFASPAAVVLVFGGAGSAFVSLFLLRNRMRGSRRDKRSGGQLPPQRGIDTEARVPSARGC